MNKESTAVDLAQQAAAGDNFTAAYDIERIRADFPILKQKVYGKPLVYLDNGASAQKPRQVLDAMNEAYETYYSNVHRGVHWTSQTSTEAFEGSRKKVAAFLDEHPNVALHFTPTYSSWLNQIELWFSKLQRDVIARGIFTSTADLARKLRRYINAYSKHAKPFRWKYSQPSRRIRHGKTISATVH